MLHGLQCLYQLINEANMHVQNHVWCFTCCVWCKEWIIKHEKQAWEYAWVNNSSKYMFKIIFDVLQVANEAKNT